jgi:hypothetical protein
MIRTTYWPKPVPNRAFDWEAALDNYEPGMPIGYGATRELAVLDLMQQLQMEDE